jgi:4-hydroxyphenylacetate 3-monooxygenase
MLSSVHGPASRSSPSFREEPEDIMRPEDVIGSNIRPYDGDEYIQSLRDGRTVYIDGEKVTDVTTHPAFRNSVRSISRLYDALHDPHTKDALTCPTDTGSRGYTHRYFRAATDPRSTIPSRPASTRTTPSSSSTRCSSPGRT